MKVLWEMLKNLREVRFESSIGSWPVRLFWTMVRLMSLTKCPISGGMKPKRGMKEMFRAVTRKSWSHVTPEKEQCAEGESEEVL